MKVLAARAKYAAFFKNSLSSFGQYRLDLLGKMAGIPFLIILNFVFWNLVFSLKAEIGGLALNEMLLYVVLVALFRRFNAQGQAKITEEEINSGNVIVQLCRPLDFFWAEVSKGIAKASIMGIIVFAAAAIAIFLLKGFAFSNIVGLFFAAILCVLFFFFSTTAYFIIGLISFWTERSWGFKWAFVFIETFFSGFFFPITLFPVAVQKILFFLPFQHMLYSPAMLAMGKFGFIDFLQSFAVLFFWCAAIFLLQKKVWNSGLAHFDGKG